MSTDDSGRVPGKQSGHATPQERQMLQRLRDVNERLVVASMHAQDLADQARASRAEAETASSIPPGH